MNLKSKAQARRLYKQRGQGMTEYIIIVALIAIAAIAVYQLFGTVVRSQTATIAQELSGQDATATITRSTAAGTQAATDTVSGSKNLSNYNTQTSNGAVGGN